MEFKIKQLSTDPQDFKIINLDEAKAEVSTLIRAGYMKPDEVAPDLLQELERRLTAKLPFVSLPEEATI
jgi:hypothetical protein